MNGASLLLSVAAISAGASLGALLRWVLGLQLNHILPSLPLGTLAANLLGGYLVGLILGWLGQHPELSPQVRLFLVTGLMGGLTTFSTFSAEVVNHLVHGRHGWAIAIAVTHLTGSLLLTALGLATVGALD
ncbi:fluoride efflux transporter CrcB [Ramlibacter alkalitolerans]|uniref:Fluoride-specific ion channel FluC n=1 Tax=Ramlibacter alkalitolerans TaxID=2039631 RepID=A0ABS1JPK9_9BURK|nr:fluoride efflux transporter CrcB [Ramlibacter alkalitolerans]MBL0426200.1 fluoride efflux transporter CrcB [Ramlibacter alkalitolerans]